MKMLLRCAGSAGIAALLVAALAPAEELEPLKNAEWTLKISQKEFDRDTGRLDLEITNTSESLAVTAFGVAVVYDRGHGQGSTRIKSKEFLPGGSLAPGAAHKLSFNFGAPAEDSTSPTALQAALHFEVLSDLTSRGNATSIDEFFLKRAHQVIELESMLERLHVARSDLRDTGVLAGFWAEETQRQQEAAHALRGPNALSGAQVQISQAERDRYEAISDLTDVSLQIKQRIDSGEPTEDSLDLMEWLLREYYLRPIFAGARQQDLERVRGVTEILR